MKELLRKWWVAFSVGVFLGTGVALAAEREFTGEVVRVDSDEQRLVLKVPDDDAERDKIQLVLWVNENTKLTGIDRLAELKEGTPVRAKVSQNWFSRKWVAQYLAVSQKPRRDLSPIEKEDLNRTEGEFAHGRIGDAQYETRRRALEPGAHLEF